MQDSAEVDAKIREAALLKRKAGDKISGSSCDKNTYSNGGGPSVEGEGGSGKDDEKSSISAASESRTKMHLHAPCTAHACYAMPLYLYCSTVLYVASASGRV